MAKKILFCATVDYHFKAFHLPSMQWFKQQGWKVDVAASGEMELPWVDEKYNLPIERSPIKRKNLEAYQMLKEIIARNNYQIIHCHTPVGGILGRLAAREARKQGAKVFYTAHGFHFCKGAPLANWLAYYPVEKSMAYYTDCLITINNEDYTLAARRFKAKQIEHINGVGIDTDTFIPVSTSEKADLKKSFGYRPDDFLLFYAAEFNKNKNQQFLLHAMALLKDRVPNARLLLAGEGALLEKCRQLAAELGISQMVDFLGFRRDIPKLVQMCDAAAASSLREGLPVNIMEAMACGLPVVALDNRGHRELVQHNKTGWIIADRDPLEFSNKLELIANIPAVAESFGFSGRKAILETYSNSNILAATSKVYQSFMGEEEKGEWAIH